MSKASFNYTGDQANKESRYEQRKKYKDLLGYLKSNQFSRFEKEKKNLENYPLYPYLIYQHHIRRLSKLPSKTLEDFIDQYADTPLAAQLRQNWLYSLHQRGQWQTFINQYEPNGSNSKRNQCFYPYALLKTGQKEDAMSIAETLWTVPYSQPDECDPIFKAWRDDDHLTPEVAWRRYESAIMDNEITLGNYLERFVDKADKPLATKLKRFHIRPQRLASETLPDLNSERGKKIYVHALGRLIRRDAIAALDVLKKNLDNVNLDAETLDTFYTDIAIRLVRNREDPRLLEDLPIDLTKNQTLIETQLLQHLRTQNWQAALVFLNLLDATNAAELRWQYWRARALNGSGTLINAQEALTIFEELAEQRSFYGFLAADHLSVDYNFEDFPESLSHEQVHALEETPGIQRALELFTLGERTRARREWNFTTQQFSDIELRLAARVAEKWGWHEQAIRAMIKAKAWDDLSPRFPLAYRDNFVQGARSQDIPVTWSMAIARQESAFMADARSSAGALGLMQLMPATAQQVARQTNQNLKSNNALTDPVLNIQLGSAYLGRMFRRFSHNRILASAAYNAGPSRVERWQDATLPLDIWIETIPFKETRNYVQNVLVFSAIYGRKLGHQSPMIYQHEWLDFDQNEPSP